LHRFVAFFNAEVNQSADGVADFKYEFLSRRGAKASQRRAGVEEFEATGAQRIRV
jgi:hypothetical protein